MDACGNSEPEQVYKSFPEALSGVVEAQYQLAVYLEEEQKDYELAAGWFKKAAGQGHIESAFRAGLLCLNSSKTVSEAAYWLTKAAQLGHARAQYQLANMYESGCGVGVDPEASLYWHREAAKRGDQSSLAKIQELNNWWGL